MNEDKERDQEHNISTRITKSMTREDVLAFKYNSLVSLFCISWTHDISDLSFPFICKTGANSNFQLRLGRSRGSIEHQLSPTKLGDDIGR